MPVNLFTPAETAANYAAAGAVKTRQPFLKQLLLSVLAGMLIGFPVCVTNMACYGLENPSLVRITAGVLFAFGLGTVVLSGAELFTGNTLIIISVLDRKATVGGMLRSWPVVYAGNFLGSLLVAGICARFGWLGSGGLAAFSLRLAVTKMTMPFENAFFMGVLCNILVTLAVLLSLSAKDVTGRFLGAWVPVMFFVVAGFSHSIADMTYCALGLFGRAVPAAAQAASQMGVDLTALTWGRYFLGNMLPVTLGNLLGGLLVGFGAWYCFLRRGRQA
jgi:formate/nitrite transporter